MTIRIRTHYDNLHVSPQASDEEIRKAYRRLSKQYHPDLNPDTDANRIMQLINQAYDVLSDPEKRAQHDRWIAEQKALQQAQQAAQSASYTSYQIVPYQTPSSASVQQKPLSKFHLFMITAVFAGLIISLLLGLYQIYDIYSKKTATDIAAQNTKAILAHQPEQRPSDTPAIMSSDVTSSGTYIRPFAAPNGNPWPKESGYIDGYPLSFGRASYQLYVDNALNSSDVYAQLWLEGIDEPLRHFFIAERSYFVLTQLNPGDYTIRYQQLDAGETLVSENIRINAKNKNNILYLKRGKTPQN